MSTVLDVAALAVTAMALIAGALTALGTRRWQLSLAVTLELFLAAGLLHLSGPRAWAAIVTAAVVVVLRQVVASQLLRPPAPVSPPRARPPGPS